VLDGPHRAARFTTLQTDARTVKHPSARGSGSARPVPDILSEHRLRAAPIDVEIVLSANAERSVSADPAKQMTDPRPGDELRDIYSARFAGALDYRNEVWRVLCRRFFSAYVPASSTVLDLGCGYGWFINNIACARKLGMDLNPTSRECLDPSVEFLLQDCSEPWDLEDGCLDVVFTSNFLEHLRTTDQLLATLGQAHRCLKPGGLLIAVGPNVKYLAGRYWDFLDHYLPLTECSLQEGLELRGFRVTRAVPRFLPYTMVGRTPALWLVALYLQLPPVWRLFGRQFLIVARNEA